MLLKLIFSFVPWDNGISSFTAGFFCRQEYSSRDNKKKYRTDLFMIKNIRMCTTNHTNQCIILSPKYTTFIIGRATLHVADGTLHVAGEIFVTPFVYGLITHCIYPLIPIIYMVSGIWTGAIVYGWGKSDRCNLSLRRVKYIIMPI